MLNKAKLILSNKTLLRRIMITLGLLLVFKIGAYIAIPLIDTTALNSAFQENSFLGILNTFSGGALGQFSIFALGISPYITASIVIQLLQLVIPKFKEWQEQGDAGKQKLNRVTRYSSVLLAFIQALALLLGLGVHPSNLLEPLMINNPELYILYYIYMAVIITAGSSFVIWLADLITKHGIGNGSSMIISAGIVSSLPSMFTTLYGKYLVGETVTTSNIASFITIIVLYVAVIVGVVFLEAITRKIPINYANRQGKSTSDIPIKLNSSGVIPVIFASTLMSLPTTLVGLLGYSADDNTFTFWINQIFTYTEPLGLMLYVFLVFIFSFFYAFMQIDPEKINDNLQKSNAFIQGVRPGDETKNFISKVLFNVTLLGATYLAVLALIPVVMSNVFNFTTAEAGVITVGGTSLLIVVGVAIETFRQLESEVKDASVSGLTRD
ncbi:MAG: preprotein translocase subunit SecY [bacterium]